MNEWPKKEESAAEVGPDNLSGLVDQLSQAVQERLSLETIDGTYEIEGEEFSITFTLENSVFEIRSITTRGPAGLGRKIIEAIHAFADEENLQVHASNVRDEARGFWTRMGYEEGANAEEYFRP